MIFRTTKIPSYLCSFLLKPLTVRHLQHRAAIPSPTPFVPDPTTFLTLIGRQLNKHASKIPSWEALFSLSSAQLKELGVEPARSRRYLLWWRDRFRRGLFGPGGDLENVNEGVGEIRVLEVKRPEVPGKKAPAPNHSPLGIPGIKKVVVNIPADVLPAEPPSADDVKPVAGMKVKGARTIVGPYVESVKGTGGSVAIIRVKEGMWEERRGHKVDGGERRKHNVRSRIAAKERGTLKA
ncbi:MAG: hypothetical protein MMC33_000735 [Icmadophila ericetorum]|nr:hypothetical protein [Icmadophila ericetorum]